MLMLGIETSCDETAAAVVRDGMEILSSVVASQVALHSKFGGVVPELASRKHMENIVPVVGEALSRAKAGREDIDAVAVTQGPGLVGSLLVGFSFAKAFSYALNIPCVGVDHLEGHVCSVFLEPKPPTFPFTVLIASGGHTEVRYVKNYTRHEFMGGTRDDAAGEAYDKVSKMLGLGYPGGRVLDELALKGDPEKIVFPKPYLDKEKFDFSFSGLKTSVRHYLEKNGDETEIALEDIAAGFQRSVIDVLSYKILNAAVKKGCRDVAIVGGVAANRGLRERMEKEGGKRGIGVCIPSPSLCGDNAAMIAAAGYRRMETENFISLEDDVYSRSSKLLS